MSEKEERKVVAKFIKLIFEETRSGVISWQTQCEGTGGPYGLTGYRYKAEVDGLEIEITTAVRSDGRHLPAPKTRCVDVPSGKRRHVRGVRHR